jgi:ribose transport system substrate-binding protein
MNRRSFLISLVVLLTAAFVGTNSARADEKLHIGVSIPTATHGWPAGVAWWAEQTMKQYPNVQWEYQRASNAAEQAGQINAMVEKGIMALVVLPFDSDTPLPAIKKAKKLGIYVTSIDRGLRDPVADLYIAGDNKAFGRKSAEWMVQHMKEVGGEMPRKIVILRGMPVEIDAERYDAAMAVFKAHPDVVTVLDSQPGNWNRQDAHNVMQTFLTKHPRIDAVWASDDDMALGVEQAVREAGRQGEMWIMGGAGMKDIVKRVIAGDHLFPADITYPPAMIAAGIHLTVADMTDGNEQAIADKIPPHLKIDKKDLLTKPAKDDKQRSLKIDVQIITPENGKEYYFPDSVY